MAALGWRKGLSAAGDVTWALKGDGFAVEMESDAAEGLSATEAEAQRLRLVVEGTAAWQLTDSTRLRKQFELGGRWDGGDADKGYGAEVGGSVVYQDTERGIEGEARGRYLLAHQSDGFEEWGGGPDDAVRPRRRRRGAVDLVVAAMGRAGERRGIAVGEARPRAAIRLGPRASWGCGWATASTNRSTRP